MRHSLLSAAEMGTTTFQKGRVHAVRVISLTLKEDLVLINIHDYDVQATTIRRPSAYMTECIAGDKRAEVFSMGDWNFPRKARLG